MLSALLLSILTQAPPWSTGQSQAGDLVVSLVTFGPGDELISWGGHTALVVEDRRLRQDRLYNYGMFTGGDGYFLRYLRGRIQIFAGDTSDVTGTYAAYRRENRDVRIQELELEPQRRLLLAQALAINVLPENKDYPYHYFRDNCSTRPRDLIDRAFAGQLHASTNQPAPLTVRQLSRNYARVNPPVSLVLDYLQNDELDPPITLWDYGFVPLELEKQLAALKVTGPGGVLVPAVKLEWSFYQAKNRPAPPAGPLDWTPLLLAFGLGLAATGVLLNRFEARAPNAWAAFNALFGLVWGVLGVALVYANLLTDQTMTYRNENLFLIHPIALLLLPAAVIRRFGSARASRWLGWAWTSLALTGLLGLALKLLPRFDQQNWNLIALVLPVSVAMALSTTLQRNRPPTP